MSKKIAAASIVALVFGGVAIPGGIFVNDMIADMVYDSVADGLLGIREQAGPEINQMVVHTFMTYLVNASLTDLEMEFEGIPITETALPSEEFFNDEDANFHVDLLLGIPEIYLFNILIFPGIYAYIDIFTIEGIANFFDEDLNYSPLAQEMILYGDEEVPGLITDVDMGSGMTDWLALYEGATTDELKFQMCDSYDCTWNQIVDIYDYCIMYLRDIMIDVLLDGVDLEIVLKNIPQGLFDLIVQLIGIELPEKIYIVDELKPEIAGLRSIEVIGEFYLFQQWANGSLVPDPGYPLPLSTGTIYGFEAGVPVSTDMSIESCEALWDEESEYSLVTKAGLAKWYEACADPDSDVVEELKAANGIDDHAVSVLCPWLENFRYNVMPFLAAELLGLPIDAISLGGVIQGAGIGVGALCIGLASTGFVSNRVVKVKAQKKALGAISKKSPKKLPDIAGDAMNPAGKELKVPNEELQEIPNEES